MELLILFNEKGGGGSEYYTVFKLCRDEEGLFWREYDPEKFIFKTLIEARGCVGNIPLSPRIKHGTHSTIEFHEDDLSANIWNH